MSIRQIAVSGLPLPPLAPTLGQSHDCELRQGLYQRALGKLECEWMQSYSQAD